MEEKVTKLKAKQEQGNQRIQGEKKIERKQQKINRKKLTEGKVKQEQRNQGTGRGKKR